jgi:hypothetical protein
LEKTPGPRRGAPREARTNGIASSSSSDSAKAIAIRHLAFIIFIKKAIV